MIVRCSLTVLKVVTVTMVVSWILKGLEERVSDASRGDSELDSRSMSWLASHEKNQLLRYINAGIDACCCSRMRLNIGRLMLSLEILATQDCLALGAAIEPIRFHLPSSLPLISSLSLLQIPASSRPPSTLTTCVHIGRL